MLVYWLKATLQHARDYRPNFGELPFGASGDSFDQPSPGQVAVVDCTAAALARAADDWILSPVAEISQTY